MNGLPLNSVKAIAQTPDGYIWVGAARTNLHLADPNEARERARYEAGERSVWIERRVYVLRMLQNLEWDRARLTQGIDEISGRKRGTLASR